jgi:tetratricopeptide (TPR) repeat protein
MSTPEGQDGKKWMKRDEATQLAIKLADAGRGQEADKVSSQLLDKFPKDPNIVAARSYVLHLQDRGDESIALLEATLKKQPNLPVFHSNLCEMHRAKDNLDKALTHGTKAIEMAPNYADAYNNLGTGHTVMGGARFRF